MEQSPLTLQSRPDTFEPKVSQLYRELFQDPDEYDKPEGFWRELFLLKPNASRLKEILDGINVDYLLYISHATQQLVQNCVATLKNGKAPPNEHALETLALLLESVFSKRYQSPSGDIIEVLAGLDHVDLVFQDLVAVLEKTISQGHTASFRAQAVRVALSITSGAFHTSLLTYFTQRDLFPALMGTVLDPESKDPILPIILCGILANCNKFEIYNPYQARIANLSDSLVLDKMVETISSSCSKLRDSYVTIQDDSPQPWSLGGTLSYVGLGSITGRKPAAPVLSEEDARGRFMELPHAEAALLLSTYDFALHNKQFALHLIGGSEKTGTGFTELCSFTTYLLQHAHRSSRTALYSHLALLILRIILESPAALKVLCDNKGDARMCRQRAPFLPITKKDRPLAALVIDVAMDAMNHNLRTNLDVHLYFSALGILTRMLSYLYKSRTRLAYHWSELWRCILSFVRFCNQYHQTLRGIDGAQIIVQDTITLITLCLTRGESFLPDTAAVDDLFYKVIESHNELTALNTRWDLSESAVGPKMEMLIHAGDQLTETLGKTNGRSKNVSIKDVMKVIKEGYDTLSMEVGDETDRWTLYREQEYKAEIKKITRMVVADGRRLASADGAQSRA